MPEAITPITGEGIRLSKNGRVLLDIDHVEIGRQGVTAILGHNGAGKSLLLKVLCGLVKPDKGRIEWNGRNPAPADYKRLGYMKQNAVLLRRSSLANLEFVLALKGYERNQARHKALEALAKAGLSEIAETSARVLSGGERQRLSLARTLIGDPDLLILDEPTASLDPVSTARIEAEVLARKNEGKSIVLVTHSLGQARRLADDILFLDQARILTQQGVSAFFTKPGCIEAADFIRS